MEGCCLLAACQVCGNHLIHVETTCAEKTLMKRLVMGKAAPGCGLGPLVTVPRPSCSSHLPPAPDSCTKDGVSVSPITTLGWTPQCSSLLAGNEGPHDSDSLTPGPPRCVHKQRFRSLFPQFPRGTWEGAVALGTRTQSAQETGVPGLPASAPHCTFAEVVVGLGGACMWPALLFIIPASLQQRQLPEASPPLSGSSLLILSTPPAKLATAFSPSFRFAPQPTILTGPSWLLDLKQLSRSFYTVWKGHVCSPTAWPDPTLGWRETLRSL